MTQFWQEFDKNNQCIDTWLQSGYFMATTLHTNKIIKQHCWERGKLFKHFIYIHIMINGKKYLHLKLFD